MVNIAIVYTEQKTSSSRSKNQHQKRPARVFGVGLASRGAVLRVLRLGGLPHAIFSSSIISASMGSSLPSYARLSTLSFPCLGLERKRNILQILRANVRTKDLCGGSSCAGYRGATKASDSYLL